MLINSKLKILDKNLHHLATNKLGIDGFWREEREKIKGAGVEINRSIERRDLDIGEE